MMTLRLSPRTRRVFEAGVSAVFGKGIVLLVNAVSIPIVVRFLGPELFGVWITISSALSILMVLDLGVANALTNLISEAYARDSRSLAAKYAANSFWVMVCLAAVLGALGALIYRRVPWAVFLHLQNGMEARRASQTIGAAYIVFLLGLPAGLAAKMLGAYQELRIANLFAVAASVAGLLGVVVVVRWHGSLPILILASFGSTVLTNYICLLWIWSVHKPWLRPSFRHWELGIARRLMSGGSEFFVLQLAGLIVFNSDNLVIAHYLGPAEVTPYSVTWKLVGYSAALQIIITPALWPAYAEAYVRGDIEWIRRMLRLVMASTMSVAGCACAVLVWFGRQIIGLWAGPVAVPPEGLLVAMCLWIMISTYMANTSTVLLATNETRMQAWLSVGAAALNLGLSILLVQRIGPIGVILATIISYMVVLIGPQTWKVYSVLHPVVSDDTAEVRS